MFGKHTVRIGKKQDILELRKQLTSKDKKTETLNKQLTDLESIRLKELGYIERICLECTIEGSGALAPIPGMNRILEYLAKIKPA